MNWPWKDGGYCKKVHGEYSLTKRESPLAYFAWHGSGVNAQLLGDYTTAEEAESACITHSTQ